MDDVFLLKIKIKNKKILKKRKKKKIKNKTLKKKKEKKKKRIHLTCSGKTHKNKKPNPFLLFEQQWKKA